MGCRDENGKNIRWRGKEKRMVKALKAQGLCERNAAHYPGKEPTQLRLGFGHNLGFSILGNIWVVST